PTFRATIASLSSRPMKCAGSTRGSMQVITNRRRFGSTTAPSCSPASAKRRLRSRAGPIAVAVVMVLLLSALRAWVCLDLRWLRCGGPPGFRESALCCPAPLDGPLGEADSHLERQLSACRPLARMRLDRAQMNERLFFALADRAEDREPVLGQAVRQEELQHAFV